MMKSAIQILIIGGCIGLGFYILKEMNEEERHPLEHEWAEIQNEFCRYYLIENKIPENLDFLSEKSKQITEIYSDQIEWDAENRTLKLTFKEQVGASLGSFITPEMIEHNSQIFKEAGKLN